MYGGALEHALDLDERIVARYDASPVTYARYAWTSSGAIYGVRGTTAPLPGTTGVHGLVLAGAATHGPGIEAVVISGAYAAEALMPGVLRPTAEGGQGGRGRRPSRPAAAA